jgi:NitT/TauT family transport system permease protein
MAARVQEGDAVTEALTDGAVQRRTRWRLSWSRVGRLLAPIVAFVVVVTLWEKGLFHTWFGLKEYTVPYPSTILEVIRDDWDSLSEALEITFKEASIGFVIGNVVGFAIAVGVVATGWGTRVLPGLAGALNSVPVVAVAPVSVMYFGFGLASKVAVVVLMTTAVMLLNSYKGLTAVANEPLDLMHSYAASGIRTMVKLRIPQSLPYVFTALKYNVTLALVGAIIAEFFGGYGGVGLQMVQALAAFAMPRAWALMILVGLIGVICFQLIVIIERLATRWHESMRPAPH